ncbi:hypothetical protein [Natrinema hispanicum]|uniref:Uncharacterized protein n=1 Tax=Natrinema hispanicum TaxID=392421 RepID=A0A1I0IUH9_9EURY|nr:hypothetical protein [Natrinema hispanicum]SEU00871.1 hypothetical protein SAMN04488694_12615 [Natrinema hispanicum]
MSDAPVVVGGYSDVLGYDELSSKDELAVVDALADTRSSEIVVWVPEWLGEEKSIEAASSSDQVFAGVVDHETENAWLIVQPGGAEDWIPKSQGVIFERAPDATLPTPQRRLDNQGGAA